MFSRPTSSFDKLLDKATSNLRMDPDWPTILQLCDMIRQGDCPPKYALASIKKKIQHQNPHIANFGLLVLESVVKNCGHLVHDEVGTKQYMEQLQEVVKTTPHEQVKAKVLEMIQAWAFAFRSNSKYRAVQDIVNIMKAEGYAFPELKESDAMFSADTAPHWVDDSVCHRCRVSFTLMQRKMACPSCGNYFCADCSCTFKRIHFSGQDLAARACQTCYQQSTNRIEESVKHVEISAKEKLVAEEEKQLAWAISQSKVEASGVLAGTNLKRFPLEPTVHHCRACGNVFCSNCSSKTCTLPKIGFEREVRVCDTCFDQHNKPRSSSPHSKVEVETLPAEYLGSSLAQQNQVPKAKVKSAEELKEEEELQLALALSQSEAEAKEKEKKRATSEMMNNAATLQRGRPSPTSMKEDEDEEENQELARYLNRTYWDQRQRGEEEADKKRTRESPDDTRPSRESPGGPPSAPTTPTHRMENGEVSETELNEFVMFLKSQVEIFVNRMKSNSSRGRSISNDSSVQSLFMNITTSHSRLLRYIQQQDDSRLYYEGLQDKLAQVKDAMAALDALRDEHQEKLRREAEEAGRLKQLQMAQKLHIMRKKKQEYLQYQRELAIQKVQEQERELQMRQEQQKQQYLMGMPPMNMGGQWHQWGPPPSQEPPYPSYAAPPPHGYPQGYPNMQQHPGMVHQGMVPMGPVPGMARGVTPSGAVPGAPMSTTIPPGMPPPGGVPPQGGVQQGGVAAAGRVPQGGIQTASLPPGIPPPGSIPQGGIPPPGGIPQGGIQTASLPPGIPLPGAIPQGGIQTVGVQPPGQAIGVSGPPHHGPSMMMPPQGPHHRGSVPVMMPPPGASHPGAPAYQGLPMGPVVGQYQQAGGTNHLQPTSSTGELISFD